MSTSERVNRDPGAGQALTRTVALEIARRVRERLAAKGLLRDTPVESAIAAKNTITGSGSVILHLEVPGSEASVPGSREKRKPGAKKK